MHRWRSCRRRSAGRPPWLATPCRSTWSRRVRSGATASTRSTLRFAKILRFGRTRNTIGVDFYNITNSAAILTYNQTFNPAATTGSQAWLAPLSVLTPRFMKIGVQIDF